MAAKRLTTVTLPHAFVGESAAGARLQVVLEFNRSPVVTEREVRDEFPRSVPRRMRRFSGTVRANTYFHIRCRTDVALIGTRDFSTDRRTSYDGPPSLKLRRPAFAHQIAVSTGLPAEALAKAGGWGGIRTHETLAGLPVFKTGALNRSATHPARPHTYQGRVPGAIKGAAAPAGHAAASAGPYARIWCPLGRHG